MKSKFSFPGDGFMGTTVVGERGQVVIPKELREQMNLAPGTKIVMFRHGNGPLVAFPMEAMRAMMGKMMNRFSKLDKMMNE